MDVYSGRGKVIVGRVMNAVLVTIYPADETEVNRLIGRYLVVFADAFQLSWALQLELDFCFSLSSLVDYLVMLGMFCVPHEPRVGSLWVAPVRG